MLLWADDFRAVFWVAVIPAVLSVALLVFGVREPEHATATQARRTRSARENLRQLAAPYWWVVAIGAVFTLARFSEAFLVLRAQQGGLRDRLGAAGAGRDERGLCAGRLSVRQAGRPMSPPHAARARAGRAGRRRPGAGARRATARCCWAGIALWGLHMALTQGLLAAMVADTVAGTTCAAPRSACSTWPAASRCWWRARWPACCGTAWAAAAPSWPVRRSVS